MAVYRFTWILIISSFLMLFSKIFFCQDGLLGQNYQEKSVVKPSVMIAILVRNKAHALPYVMGFLEKLDYPKDRISFWIRSDHNEDNTSISIREWVAGAKKIYNSVNFKVDETNKGYPNVGPLVWTDERFYQIMKLKQQALEAAFKAWADYIFYVDADVLLENPNTLTALIDQNKLIVAPMLNASIVMSTYSNFWGGINDKGYYKRVPEYFPIVNRFNQGCFKVPLVHSAILINLRDVNARNIVFYPAYKGYTGPNDDIIQFALTCQHKGIPMHILNTEFFGHMAQPLDEGDTLDLEKKYFLHAALETMVNGELIKKSSFITTSPVPKDKLKFDEVYLVNLVRRPDRRNRMLTTLDELGIDAKLIDAVDGRNLDDSYLEKHGIVMLPGYADPYWNRKLTMGEIGCFMSHYNIWLEVLDKRYDRVMVFEDDLRFEPLFRETLYEAMDDIDSAQPDWDLVYIGRKILHGSERFLDKSKRNVVYPAYSYWTLAYAVSYRGARKLVDAKPLEKLVPVDEYLPIMFDEHINDTWSSHFPKRDLIALSVNPLLIFPTHYVGEPDYFSDTEASSIIEKSSDPSTSINELNSQEINISPSNQHHELNLDQASEMNVPVGPPKSYEGLKREVVRSAETLQKDLSSTSTYDKNHEEL